MTITGYGKEKDAGIFGISGCKIIFPERKEGEGDGEGTEKDASPCMAS